MPFPPYNSVNWVKRVCHLTNETYLDMLYIKRLEGMGYITIRGRVHVQASSLSWNPQYGIALSRVLLIWVTMDGRVPYPFTNFITTPELSGPLYMSPDIYHTQITEYLLEKAYHE